MSTATQEKAKEEPVPPPRSVDKDEHHGEESSCKKTLGEELFLVHLNRFAKLERSPDDFDHTTNPKEVVEEETVSAESGAAADATTTTTKATEATAKELTSPPTKIRAASIGEELWEVHCRRTQGLPPDYEDDDGDEAAAAADDEKMKKDTTAAAVKKTGAKKNKAVRAATDGATTIKQKRVKVAVEQSAREIHLRNRDVKVEATTTATTKSQH